MVGSGRSANRQRDFLARFLDLSPLVVAFENPSARTRRSFNQHPSLVDFGDLQAQSAFFPHSTLRHGAGDEFKLCFVPDTSLLTG